MSRHPGVCSRHRCSGSRPHQRHHRRSRGEDDGSWCALDRRRQDCRPRRGTAARRPRGAHRSPGALGHTRAGRSPHALVREQCARRGRWRRFPRRSRRGFCGPASLRCSICSTMRRRSLRCAIGSAPGKSAAPKSSRRVPVSRPRKGHCSEYGVPTRIIDSPADVQKQLAELAPKRPDVIKVVYDHGQGTLPSIDRPRWTRSSPARESSGSRRSSTSAPGRTSDMPSSPARPR